MNVLTVIFWVSCMIVFYSYFGYGILLFCIIQIKKKIRPPSKIPSQTFEPAVALVIPAYNEEEIILQKISNTLELDYPREKLTVIFVTDGSTDQTPRLISNYPQFKLMHNPERRGKPAAINRVMSSLNAPFVIFCDANTLINRSAVREIVKHYLDPAVGGVAGEKKILQVKGTTVSSGEGLYWKYESFLKKMDSEFYSVVGAAGELLSFRTNLYEAVEEDTIIEDFVSSLRVCLKGYVVRYEPAAYAIETASLSITEEQKRKVRIGAGAFQAMRRLTPLLNITKYSKLSFQYISHRVLRWTVCPLCLFLIFISNLILIFSPDLLYVFLFSAQLAFYTLAVLGWIFASRNLRIKFLYIPYYFLFMNASIFIGLYRTLTDTQSVLWQKSSREKLN